MSTPLGIRISTQASRGSKFCVSRLRATAPPWLNYTTALQKSRVGSESTQETMDDRLTRT